MNEKTKKNRPNSKYYDTSGCCFFAFFGRNEDTINCFWNLLTFSRKKIFVIFCLHQIFTTNLLWKKSCSIFHPPLSYKILSIGFCGRFIKLVSFFTHCTDEISFIKNITLLYLRVWVIWSLFVCFRKIDISSDLYLIYIKLVFRFK